MSESRKNALVAYLLVLTTGFFGGHNFYLGRYFVAFTQLGLALIGLKFAPLLVTLVLVWALVDLFFMRSYLQRANDVDVDVDTPEVNHRAANDEIDVASYNRHQTNFQAAYKMGDLPAAARHGTLALAALRTANKGRPTDVLATNLNNMGCICRELKDLNQARVYAEESVSVYRQLGLKTADAEMVSSINNLALIFADMGDHAAAERLYKQQLSALPPGQATDDGVRLLNNLATLYGQMGNPMQAELAYEKALAIAAKVAGMDVTLHTSLLNNCASTLMDRKAWPRARELYGQALALQERVCKGISRAAATSHNDLGVMAEKLGDLATAQLHHERALHVKQICVPDDLLDIAASEHSLGGIYFARGNFALAKKMVDRVVSTYTQQLGPTHSKTLEARANLANIQIENVSPQRAVPREPLHNFGEAVAVGSGWAARRLFAANSRAIGKKSNAVDRPSPADHRPQGVMQRFPSEKMRTTT